MQEGEHRHTICEGLLFAYQLVSYCKESRSVYYLVIFKLSIFSFLVTNLLNTIICVVMPCNCAFLIINVTVIVLFRMLLRYAFSQLRSTQIATVHCSAQTSSRHILQKLTQTCLVISTNTGRVYRPKDCERLVLYLKDINLPKPDKWGTNSLVAFLQQVRKIL